MALIATITCAECHMKFDISCISDMNHPPRCPNCNQSINAKLFNALACAFKDSADLDPDCVALKVVKSPE